MRHRHAEAVRIPLSSSARTVRESEVPFQTDGISRLDSAWQDGIGCASELQVVNVEPLQFHFNLSVRCSPLGYGHDLDLLGGQEKHVEPAQVLLYLFLRWWHRCFEKTAEGRPEFHASSPFRKPYL